jgi:hypothetical protein
MTDSVKESAREGWVVKNWAGCTVPGPELVMRRRLVPGGKKGGGSVTGLRDISVSCDHRGTLSPAPIPGINTGPCNCTTDMNRQAHLVIGIALFLVYFYAAGLFHSTAGVLTTGALFISGIVAVSVGSLFPDLIEPATSARHRGFFHSRRVLKIVCVFFLLMAFPVLFIHGISRSSLIFGISCSFLGYAAHLLADSVTRAGLPG